MATTCLFTAAKEEECPRNLSHFARAYFVIRFKEKHMPNEVCLQILFRRENILTFMLPSCSIPSWQLVNNGMTKPIFFRAISPNFHPFSTHGVSKIDFSGTGGQVRITKFVTRMEW